MKSRTVVGGGVEQSGGVTVMIGAGDWIESRTVVGGVGHSEAVTVTGTELGRLRYAFLWTRVLG